jgi:hypothetical protein
MTYLRHVTLDTGHSRRSPRDEADPAAVAVVEAHLERALAAGGDPILDLGYSLEARAAGLGLLGTILTAAGRPVLTFGVAPRGRVSGPLWALLHESRSYPTGRQPPPQTPWLAARFETAELVPAVAAWAADYERLVAWAWIDMKTGAAHA